MNLTPRGRFLLVALLALLAALGLVLLGPSNPDGTPVRPLNQGPPVDPTYHCVDDGTPAWSCYLADDVPSGAHVVFTGPRSTIPLN